MSGLVIAVQDNAVSPGLLGFLVVAALGVATWLLVRSMTRQMRKIDLPDERTETEAPPPSPPSADQPADPA
jgi:hypothetical protein